MTIKVDRFVSKVESCTKTCALSCSCDQYELHERVCLSFFPKTNEQSIMALKINQCFYLKHVWKIKQAPEN